MTCSHWAPINTDVAGRDRVQVCRNCHGSRVEHAAAAVRRVIGHRVAGFCYVCSEAVYHLAGGKRAGLVPMRIVVQGTRPVGSHWWLEDRRNLDERGRPRVIDVTAGQFRPRLTRAERKFGRGCGFLTRRPSVGAREIIAAVRRDARWSGFGDRPAVVV